MSVVSTKAIVLSSLKYGDSSLIVKCFTKDKGLLSFMVKGVLNTKRGKIKAAYFQPLTLLTVSFNFNPKKQLHNFKEVGVSFPYNSIPTVIVKQSIVLFLSEVLSNAIQEEETNHQLFQFLEYSLQLLDSSSTISNFHLVFLVQLTRFLGFYPDNSLVNASYFNLEEGVFTNHPQKGVTITGKDLILFKSVLGIHFDALEKLLFSKQERQMILQILIRYFQLHLGGFKKPKSLPVLETIFS